MLVVISMRVSVRHVAQNINHLHVNLEIYRAGHGAGGLTDERQVAV